MRVLIETIHIAAGLAAAMLIAALAAWSYPLAHGDIWHVTYVAMAAVVLMGVGPIRRALAADRAKLAQPAGATDADG
jgi:hypothetical protein